jgi:hypothetical protein
LLTRTGGRLSGCQIRNRPGIPNSLLFLLLARSVREQHRYNPKPRAIFFTAFLDSEMCSLYLQAQLDK